MPVKGKRKRSKQGYLEGMAPPSIPELDAATDHYYEVMMERCDLSKQEDEAKTQLIEKMLEHHQSRYVTPDGLVVDLLSKSGIKVKRKKEKAESNGEAEDE